MTIDNNLPEGVGPHEEKELDLMLSGDKPLAMFSDTIPSSMELPEVKFQPYRS
ncbi:Hemocin immunity protein (fragment) [Candidatus Terasakiella magnetica]|uniref:Hemocin immunity protein n=1 Tax=Candidatus Terasakiella magnetica TaxID=1867952 RepID=A0A1C3RFA7_9PROT